MIIEKEYCMLNIPSKSMKTTPRSASSFNLSGEHLMLVQERYFLVLILWTSEIDRLQIGIQTHPSEKSPSYIVSHTYRDKGK